MAHPVLGVNAGILAHRERRRGARLRHYGPVKLANLRRRPQVSATFRSGWEWLTVEGTAQLLAQDRFGCTDGGAAYLDLMAQSARRRRKVTLSKWVRVRAK